MPDVAPAIRFGRFELQPQERRLLADGRDAGLGGRALDVLIVLVHRAGSLVSRNELIDLAWPGLVVEENNLSVQISALRKVLGGEIIATVPGRGYRFTAALDDGPAEAAPVAAPVPAAKLKTNLPATLPPLIGRDADLAALGAWLDAHRLVTLVGAGGIGKTLLSQHLLAQRQDRYSHGVCWVELAALVDAATLPAAVAAALGMRLGSGAGAQALAQTLAPLELLLVLDNAEHLLADVAALAEALHGAAPRLRLLVTSQAPLKIAAEHLLRLEALAVPDAAVPIDRALAHGAVALFAERARAVDARFVLTQANLPEAIELCRALDGLPLAIELAAARAPLLGVQRLAASMHERLRLLARGSNRHAPQRQQTLRAALEWSHALLDEAERTVFRRLCVVAGSADLELLLDVVVDAADGALDRWAALDALSSLVERSLVAMTADAEPMARYRLLDSPRALAREKLQESGESDAWSERHARALAVRFDGAYDELFAQRIPLSEWQMHLPDFDDARLALAWAEGHGDAELALAIVPPLLRMRPAGAGQAWLNACADRCETLANGAAPSRRTVRALLEAGLTHDLRPRRAHALAARALEMVRNLPALDAHQDLLYWALCDTAKALSRMSPGDAQPVLDEARAVERAEFPALIRRSRWYAEAVLARARGDADAAVRAQEQFNRLSQASGSPLATANVIDAQLFAGRIDDAVRTGRELVTQLEGTRSEDHLVLARLNLAAALLAGNDAAAARGVCEKGWAQAVHFEMQPYWADYLALLAALECRAADAARLVGYADAGYARKGDERQGNEAAAVTRARTLARATMGDSEWASMRAEGAACSDEQIPALAFARAPAQLPLAKQ